MENEKPKRKGGRPKKAEVEKRKHNITVALTPLEYQKVIDEAERHGQKPNVFLRQLALDRKLPKQVKPKVDRDTYITLTNIGNMLVSCINKAQSVEVARWLQTLKKEINELRMELVK